MAMKHFLHRDVSRGTFDSTLAAFFIVKLFGVIDELSVLHCYHVICFVEVKSLQLIIFIYILHLIPFSLRAFLTSSLLQLSFSNSSNAHLIIGASSFGIIIFLLQKKSKFDLTASMTRGREIYSTYCVSCHQEQGEGVEDIYPPLAKSDYLMADKKRSILQVLKGASGEMKVNGKIYNMEMVGFNLSAQETSDVLNYIRNSFGNKGEAITPDQVTALKK